MSIQIAAASMLIALAQVSPVAGPSPGSEAPAPAAVKAPDAQHGRVLYLKHCPGCHGSHARGDGPREIPALAAQREDYLIQQLSRFASGERPGSAAHGPAMRDTLQAPDVNRTPAMRDLAAYLARAQPDPQPEHGEGLALSAGRSGYVRACAACHGEDGTGSDRGPVPRIGGQHFRYLLSRLRDFGSAHRGLAPAALAAAAALSGAEQQAVADYVSRLPGGSGAP